MIRYENEKEDEKHDIAVVGNTGGHRQPDEETRIRAARGGEDDNEADGGRYGAGVDSPEGAGQCLLNGGNMRSSAQSRQVIHISGTSYSDC